MKLWAGRMTGQVDEKLNALNASIGFDSRMYRQDIAGSIAHATMLGKVGVVTGAESAQIVEGLKGILSDLESGALEIDRTCEDIHTFVEGELTRRIGAPGKKLHTGRSRNDQVALDIRLYLAEQIDGLIARAKALIGAFCDVAKAHLDAVMPGYTHLQRAQPVTLGHYLMAYAQMLLRDVDRLSDCRRRTMVSPLGSGALAGTTYPLDRQMVSDLLGMNGYSQNSLDGVSDRDFALELLGDLSILMMHLSRFSEEICMWCSWEFRFVTLSDAFSTGSSIMPQKKNPDFAELIRGKSGRVYGNLVQLLVTMKGLPLAYNKDLQEDKEGALDTAHTLMQCLSVMAGMISTWTVNEDAMARECGVGHLAATDVADYLAKRGLPFREAHAVVGHLVLMCEKRGCNLEDLPFEVFQEASPLFERDITEALDIPSIVAARTTEGGTAPAAVAVQLQRAEAQLVADEDVVGSLTKVVEMGHGAN